MQLTITIDDTASATRILEGVCTATKYDAGSGMTKADWVRKQIETYLKTTAYRGEARATADAIGSQINAIVVH